MPFLTNFFSTVSPEETGAEHPPESADLQSTSQKTEEKAEDAQVLTEPEKNLTSTPEKAPPALAPPQLAQLRTENADSFDMEEVRGVTYSHLLYLESVKMLWKSNSFQLNQKILLSYVFSLH